MPEKIYGVMLFSVKTEDIPPPLSSIFFECDNIFISNHIENLTQAIFEYTITCLGLKPNASDSRHFMIFTFFTNSCLYSGLRG